MVREVLVVCEDCGAPYAGYYDSDDEVRIESGSTCPSCDGSSLREIAPDEIGDGSEEGDVGG